MPTGTQQVSRPAVLNSPAATLLAAPQTSVSSSAAGVEALVAHLSQAMAAAEAPLAGAGAGHNGSGHNGSSYNGSHANRSHSYW